MKTIPSPSLFTCLESQVPCVRTVKIGENLRMSVQDQIQIIQEIGIEISTDHFLSIAGQNIKAMQSQDNRVTLIREGWPYEISFRIIYNSFQSWRHAWSFIISSEKEWKACSSEVNLSMYIFANTLNDRIRKNKFCTKKRMSAILKDRGIPHIIKRSK